MSVGLRHYLTVFAIALAAAYVITPFVERLSVRLGAVDHPGERKVHDAPVPRLGGVAIYLAFMAALLVDFAWRRFVKLDTGPYDIPLLPILAGATIVLIVGVLDDVFDLSAGVKFFGQIVAALVMVVGPLLMGQTDSSQAVLMEFIGNPRTGDLVYLATWSSVPLTLLWVVAMTNIVNLIDGLDGLAAGVGGIAMVSLSYAAYMTGHSDIAIVALALAGSSLGFLKHNFYPAHIFMGDSGSMFMGFILGAITVEGVMKSVATIALLIPIVMMGIPILDTAFAIFRRMKGRQPVSRGDNDHIHHRLLYRGFSHRQTVIIIYLWSALLSFSALRMKFGASTERAVILVPLAILSFFLAEYSGVFEWLRKLRDRE